MSHPTSCKDPDCTLSYRAHLLSISFDSAALPTRNKNLDVAQTNIREKRWHRDHEAFRRLVRQGYQPPQIDGSRFRERAAQNDYDVNCRKVDIDWTDPT